MIHLFTNETLVSTYELPAGDKKNHGNPYIPSFGPEAMFPVAGEELSAALRSAGRFAPGFWNKNC